MERDKHFLVGIFNDQDDILNAVPKVRESGVKIHEVYNPFPIHHMEHALGYKRSRMPVAAFFFGLTGTVLAIIMQFGMLVVDWPMIIGGKPFAAIPDFIPIIFELTVLLSAFGMGFTFFGTQGFHPFKVPRIFDIRSTDDKHVMAIDLADNEKSEEELKKMLSELGAEEAYRRDFTEEDEKKRNFIPYAIDVFLNGVTRSSRLGTK